MEIRGLGLVQSWMRKHPIEESRSQTGNKPVVIPVGSRHASGGHLCLVEARKLSLRDAARAAGVSGSMIRKEIKEGRLPTIKIGAKSLILERDLENYLRGHYVIERLDDSGSHKAALPAWVEDAEVLKPVRNRR